MLARAGMRQRASLFIILVVGLGIRGRGVQWDRYFMQMIARQSE